MKNNNFLTEKRILVSKKVHYLTIPLIFNGVEATSKLKNLILTLSNQIENGIEIDPKHYRRSTNGDKLLINSGVMHLHLTHAGDDTILYLMQFDDDVLFLEVSDHRYLNSVPPGQNFNMFNIYKKIGDIFKEPEENDVPQKPTVKLEILNKPKIDSDKIMKRPTPLPKDQLPDNFKESYYERFKRWISLF
jgi:hypothetical protein